MTEIQLLEGKTLEEKIKFYLQYQGDIEGFHSVFSDTEWNVLCALQRYEELRIQLNMIVNSAPTGLNQEEAMILELEMMDCERDSILMLKRQMSIQLDILLQQERINAWCEILVWYQYVIQKDLAHRFWEFYVLKIILNIFVIEHKEKGQTGKPPSVMQLHGMKELQDVYFKTVFLLRRLEYEVEPMDELREYIKERGFTSTFVNYILENAQINNKEKVRKAIESWC